MKLVLYAILGYLTAVFLLDQFIIYTREPLPAECDGGENG
jgi:hypothetical protein